MNMTSYEKGWAKGVEEGIEKGIEKARRTLLYELLDERFGPLTPAVLQAVEQISAERLEPLLKAARKALSLAELGLDE